VIRSYLRSLPVAALIAAAVDSWFVRADFHYRGGEPWLYPQAVALWLAGGALAIVPILLFHRLVRGRQFPGPVACGIRLLGWTGCGILVHSTLDASTELGGNLEGLRSAWPWLRAGGIVLGTALVVRLLVRVADRWPARTTALVASVLALAAGLATGIPSGQLRRPAAAAPAASGPNLLLLVWDTTRSLSLNIYGYERDTTVGLKNLAAESIVFDNARSPSAFTFTSHLSMLTGVYPSHHGARMMRQVFDAETTPTIASILHENGYRTAAFVGTAVLLGRTGMEKGFERFDDRVDPPVCDTRAWALVHDVQAVLAELVPLLRFNGLPHWFQDFQRPAGEVLARARAWIEEEDPRPWFCMINLYDVHWPYLPAPEAREKWVGDYAGPIDGYLFRSNKFPGGPGGDERSYKLSPEDDRHLTDLYDGELWELDRTVAAFLDGLGDDCALLLTSDHGEAFGEGGAYLHDNIKEAQVQIPLLVRPPRGGTRKAERRTDAVSGIDVAPTLLSLAGIEPPEHMTGRNLLDEAPSEPRAILVEDRDHYERSDVRLALYRFPWKLVRLGVEEHRYELYDLRADPLGLVDVAAENPDLVKELGAELSALRSAWGAEDLDLEEGDIDREALKALGYILH
jgi:arylsulfatase A-like enzyme